MSVLLPIQAGTLPGGTAYCFQNWQQTLLDFANVMNAVLPGETLFNFGADLPDPSLNSYPWFRTTDGRWYFYSGDWISPVNYDTNERRLFVGSLVDLQTYDGGDTGASSDRSGPMWVEDTLFQGRSPMHPGTIPQSDPSKILSVVEDYGDGSHAQTVAEMATHKHTPEPTEADGFLGHAVSGAPATYNVLAGGDTISMGDTAATGDGDPMSIVHPVRGIYVIKWSGRLYRKV